MIAGTMYLNVSVMACGSEKSYDRLAYKEPPGKHELVPAG